MPSVLIASGDATESRFLVSSLQGSGFATATVEDGQSCLRALATTAPSVVLCAVRLPDMTGVELCREIRRGPRTCQVAVALVQACATPTDRIDAFESGADTFIALPCHSREVRLRCQALVRRISLNEQAQCSQAPPGACPVRVMPLERRCIFHGRLIDLTAVEVRLLQFFVDHPDRVLSRAELMQAVWNGQPIEARNVAMHVNNLREKLAAAGGAIATVRKLGYRFDATPACHPSGTP